MKIVFMGTPHFAVPSLKLLMESHHHVVGVVTTPDKRAGRGHKIWPSPIKMFAEENNIPVLQPAIFTDVDFIKNLTDWNADLFVIVAFKILPEAVFGLPPKGTVNVHASLLPKYRGAAPINWALINGDSETGVTTFFIEKKVDTGEILLQHKVNIGENTTAGELFEKLAFVGADLLLQTANGIEAGTLFPQKQHGEVTLAPKLVKELGQINWDQSARQIFNLVRGLSPIPSAYSYFKGGYVKILKTALSDLQPDTESKPGAVISIPKNGPIKVQTVYGVIDIIEIQPQGKKVQTAGEFIRGYRVKEGDLFGDLSSAE